MPTTTVQLNDVLIFPASGQIEKTITWKQSLKERSEKYYAISAKNTTRGNAGVNLFVQKDMFESLGKATEDGKSRKFTVTPSFQYGQKNLTGDKRFLVLHDKSRKPYQHRFIETVTTALPSTQAINTVKEMAHNFGWGDGEPIVGPEAFLKPYVGNSLWNF